MSATAKHILIVGGAGFIGSNLAERLAPANKVYIADNMITGSWDNIYHLVNGGNVVCQECDANNKYEIVTKFDRDEWDEIYYLASIASPLHYLAKPFQTIWTNTVGLHYTLEIARDCGAKFLYTSTSEVYGDPEVMPQPETYCGKVDPGADRSVYDESKRLGETICAEFQRRWPHFQTKIVRIFNTYGPRMHSRDGRVIPTFINQAMNIQPMTVYGGGFQTRSFCYIDDMVNGLLAMMASNELGPINLGNPDEFYEVRDIGIMISELLDLKFHAKSIPFPSQNDPQRRKPDITRAREVLRWEPKVEIREGLNKTIEYFRRLRSENGTNK